MEMLQRTAVGMKLFRPEIGKKLSQHWTGQLGHLGQLNMAKRTNDKKNDLFGREGYKRKGLGFLATVIGVFCYSGLV